MEFPTIKQLLEQKSEEYRSQIAFQIRQEQGFRQYTFGQVNVLAQKIQAALIKLGVKYSDRVALLSQNRPEWVISYLAIVSMGAVVVPLDAMLSKDEILLLLDDCGARAVILSQEFEAYIQGTKLDKQKLFMEGFDNLSAAADLPKLSVKLDDLASLVYTSGTTGSAKGVMLTHGNIMSNVISVSSLFDFGPQDNFLSVLPLHHTFETTAGFLGPFYNGSTVTYTESLKSYNILRNMREAGVTIMCGVPLLFQLFYDGIMREVEEQGKQKLFSILLFVSKLFKHVIGLNIGKMLFSMVHKKFGSKIRFFVSGGAALDPALIKGFELLGFTILQGYGLTESAPILSCCTLKNNRIGSVGKPIPGVDLKISGTDLVGEILAFGPNIMKGYYKRKEYTSRVLVNGWLHTGDVGYLDEEGYLFITGRAKNVIVTSSGVNVYPQEIEFVLNKLPAVKESCVFGGKVLEGVRRGSEQVVALIVPDMEYFAKTNSTQEGFVFQAISEQVQTLNKNLADFKRIARFIIRKEELPKTRLKKIKRFELKKELAL